MKRVILAAFIGAALFVFAYRPAHAAVEFCPATLQYERVDPHLYGFELSALGPRTITSATLAFDTSGGWFTVDVPGVSLIAKERHYVSASGPLIRKEYVAPEFYARFPIAVSVSRAWVFTAATQSDTLFGWDKAGTVQCDPSPQEVQLIGLDRPAPRATLSPAALFKRDPQDGNMLSRPPAASALIIDAKQSKPLESATCAQPFQDAMVKLQAVPEYPIIMRELGAGRTTSTIQVAIAADGTLSDAWVVDGSGYEAADAASLAAARNSTYEGARAYCKPVPGEYYFRVTFEPNG
jgi:hypothetical protein